MDRVANLGTDRAAAILVDVLTDPSLKLDGEGALRIRTTIVECGRPCIPYLRRVQGEQRSSALSLVECIETGRPGF